MVGQTRAEKGTASVPGGTGLTEYPADVHCKGR